MESRRKIFLVTEQHSGCYILLQVYRVSLYSYSSNQKVPVPVVKEQKPGVRST